MAVNPLLLSLIVLDHSVKLVLPEERHILYRDCVEILAAKWRQQRRAELSVTVSDDIELSLSQKVDLLQAIALEMQKQRTRPDAGQIPIPRARAEELIAAQLPALLTALPGDAAQRRALCEQKATAWLDGIKMESGILLEVGLDETGEPVIAFSHLTFQEYLAALAIKDQVDLYSLLLDNLLNPAWEEVLLLYAGIAQEATSLVRQLIAKTTAQPGAWLIAGRVLTERTRVDQAERQSTMDGMHQLVRTGNASQRLRGCEILTDIATPPSAPILVQVTEKDPVWKVRYAAAQALGKLGDPRFDHLEPEMVTVPAGEFGMGDGEVKHPVNLPEFLIGKYPVTNAEYKRFIDETGHRVPSNWQGNVLPSGKANHPVVQVSWHDAQAYCEWVSKKTGKNYRLPTEAEWEKAGRGTDGRAYPWGNEFSEEKCNTYESGIGTTTPVGIYLDGASPYGAFDMAGNVWEWCADWYDGDYYKNSPVQNPKGPDSGTFRVLRGGSWLNTQGRARSVVRSYDYPASWDDSLGFRVVVASSLKS